MNVVSEDVHKMYNVQQGRGKKLMCFVSLLEHQFKNYIQIIYYRDLLS